MNILLYIIYILIYHVIYILLKNQSLFEIFSTINNLNNHNYYLYLINSLIFNKLIKDANRIIDSIFQFKWNFNFLKHIRRNIFYLIASLNEFILISDLHLNFK